MQSIRFIVVLLCGSLCPGAASSAPTSAEDLMIVDCLLPGQIRKLGQRATYLTARRPVKTTAFECRVRGGEYVAYDRANLGTALRVWLDAARKGNVEAMVTVGELFERGIGTQPDYRGAAQWYGRAAERGSSRAQINLGSLYEQGLGVEHNPGRATELYRQAAGLPNSIALANEPQAGTADVPVAGPQITLIEPAIGTRGLVKTEVVPKIAARQLVGRIDAPAGLLTLNVDGRPIETNAAGIFRVALEEPDAERQLLITAIDERGARADLSLTLLAGGESSVRRVDAMRQTLSREDFGNYHSLLIANYDYRRLPDLNTPAADVALLNELLKNRYGFSTTVLVNATRYQILSALNDIRAKLTSDDNLLVYYAGHGELDVANNRGHWLPVDADPDNTANWISNVSITDILNVVSARQILLVADSCYAGTLTRSSIANLKAGMTEAEHNTWLRIVAKKRARLVLTSGGVAPVLDSGGGRHSVFAGALIDTLEQNRDILSGRALYQAVTARVAHVAANYEFEQVPEFAPISRAGHEAGDFFLVPDSQ